MAGRTRRADRTPTTTEAPEPEVVDAEQAAPETQEEATEAPETSQEADVSATTEEAPAQDEAQVETPAEDATEAPAQTEAPAEEAKPKTAEELYAEFQAVTNGAVERSDQTTGTVPEADLAGVLAAYKPLSSTGRNSKSDAKTWIADVMKDTLMAGNMPGATAWATINKAVVEASNRRSSTAPAKVTISPTDAYVERYVAHILAPQFIPVPEGLEADWQAKYNEVLDRENKKVEAYKEWLAKPEAERGDEPEGTSSILKDAAKLGQGKSVGRRASGTRKAGGGTGGSRKDVKKHIEEFLDTVEVGSEHTVAEIANFKSSEYTEGEASPGAVAARLFPGEGKQSSVNGFELVEGGGTRKIRKLAA